MDTFGPPKQVLVRGKGIEVWDADGKRYLDGLGGIAVNSLGHAHPALTEAVSNQINTLGHISNFFASTPQVELAEKLLEISNAPAGSRVFFTNSGTEANEAAFKMTRRVPLAGLNSLPSVEEPPGGVSKPTATTEPTRTRILALENAFHGRSMGALALTHKAAYREPFAPLPPGVEFVPVASAVDPLVALREAFDPAKPPVAALFLEPIQGEAGVKPLPQGYLQLARELCTEHGALLIFDEIQTGMGRTGTWFAHQHPAFAQPPVVEPARSVTPPVVEPARSATVETTTPHVQPDVMTLAKGLGGGFPMGAVIAFGQAAAQLLGPGMHGTTFGGNPLAAAAGNAVIETIEKDNLLNNVQESAAALVEALNAANQPEIKEVRGLGLLIAVQLQHPIAQEVAAEALNIGLIVNPVAPDAIRLAPSLILTKPQAQEIATLLLQAITNVASVG